MRKKKKKMAYAGSKKFLSGVLYTTKSKPLSQRDFVPSQSFSKNKRQPAFLQKIKKSFDATWQKLGAAKRPQKTRHMNFESERSTPKSKLFYASVSIVAVVMMTASVAFAAGAFDDGVAHIRVNDAGRILAAETATRTVGEFLEKNNIDLEDGDVLEVSLATPIEDGMEIVIRRAMPMTVLADAKETDVRMLAGTVGEALNRAGITLSAKDEVYPTTDTYVSEGLKINVIRVTEETIVEKETLHFKEITKKDNTLEKGKTKVVTQGQNGVQENTILVVYKNGVEVSREVVKQEVTKEPVDEVVHIGTYVAPKKQESSSSSNQGSSSSSKNESSGSKNESSSSSSSGKYKTNSDGKVIAVPSTSLIHSGTLYEHKNAPEPDPSIIAKTVVINHITAYTHTGNRTATGTMPRIGTIAADPKRFPYGTKVYVPGYGYGRIEDTGGFRNEERTVFDLFMESERECLDWGRKYDRKVYILK